MAMKIFTNEKIASIRALYPTLSERELREAETNLQRYFEIALEICGEDQSGSVNAQFDSTRVSPSMEERSNATLRN